MEWKTYKLSEIGEIVGGATPSTKISEYYNGDIPWISPKDLSNFEGKYISCGSKNITELGFNSCSCKILPKGSVLFSSRAPIGYIAIAKNSLCTNQGFKSVIPNSSIIDSEFLYYTLVFNKENIKNQGSGTTFMEVSGKTMGNIEVSIPVNLSDQRKIAGILSALDSKIENNNKINANLEAQAQALFKSWFVDFTPFKDQPFVDSELGPIPQGWKVGKYEDIILDTLAGDWGKEKITGNYTHEVACVRGCDFQDMNNGYRGNTPQRYILEKNYSAKRLLPQDLIIEISGGTLTVSTGRACLVSKEMLEKYDNNLVCTNFCKVIRPIDGYSAYCYYSWLHKYNNRVMFGYENGSSGLKNFRFKDFLTKEPLLIPPKADLIKFQHIIKLLQQKKQTNGTESTKLAALRDTLLPKLMSGEIKL
ncbi:MAG: restriction endonuclease subunit S [Sodaliphilus sp.]|nr:restriction endonuclease subunit S [Sodaliphilus sp.]